MYEQTERQMDRHRALANIKLA